MRFPGTMFLVLLPGAQREKDLGSKAHFAVSMTIKDMLGVTPPPFTCPPASLPHTHRFLDDTIFSKALLYLSCGSGNPSSSLCVAGLAP